MFGVTTRKVHLCSCINYFVELWRRQYGDDDRARGDLLGVSSCGSSSNMGTYSTAVSQSKLTLGAHGTVQVFLVL